MPSPFQPQQVYQQSFLVSFEYPVVFRRDVFAGSDETLAWAISRKEPARRHPVVFVVDSGVNDAWPSLAERTRTYIATHEASLELRDELILVPGGEHGKNDQGVLRQLLQRLADAKLDRQAAVVAIGGGAALDVIGYAASLVHRGVRVVRIPTTVLAQGDSGVGVKTSVNRFGAKNFLGTFAPPFAVINDARWLETLSLRDLRAGLAEGIKVALIKDAAFFTWLEANAAELRRPVTSELPNPALEAAIRRCAELHLEHIATAGDPFELGAARPLDYGHWAAHRLEIGSEHELRHGEAVGIGMLLDARYAELAGLLSSHDVERLLMLVSRLGLPLFHPVLAERRDGRLAILQGLDDFREHLGGTLTVTLLTGVGQRVEVNEMDAAKVEAAVEWLSSEAETRTRPI
jgi:3-dehydroquinate synthase